MQTFTEFELVGQVDSFELLIDKLDLLDNILQVFLSWTDQIWVNLLFESAWMRLEKLEHNSKIKDLVIGWG